ncbi:hypothetical protein Q4E93_14765 [Flavitalea sp. BT771]|uniref:hypothetical protein n=1 Tax=Flavitalea sp. BT771 TaxID=3063329 RepID=UPI0026E24918|nr:hypothetical protein [Flavitalea sp. BT771]MDO6431865.1 hypothetical protein [Flavitalea sp. BT771]MDV6220774.1 hypothetical protein [Flavitalea sp. BT771]
MNIKIVITGLLLVAGLRGRPQMPLLDRGVLAEGLWCFPLYGDTLKYVYLPNQAGIVPGRDSLPQFSYMRYVMSSPAGSGNTTGTIDQADGGAILNFLVWYSTPPDAVEAAEQSLRRKLKNDSLRIRGPLVFDDGRYSLVSSIIAGDSNVKKNQILSSGNAPVLENSQIALSFGLTPLTSKILTENFKMNTPDISMMFDMGFTGLTEDYDAELDINWSDVKKSQGFNAGGSIYFVSADVKLAFDEMFKNQSIVLKVNGSNAPMEALLNTVYDKLLNLMFAPVQPEQLPAQQQNDLAGAISQLTGPNGILSSGKTTGFGLNVGYQLKEMKSTGVSKLFFKGRSTVQHHHFIAFNIGPLYKKYGSNKSLFRDAPLIEAPFERRSIVVGIDGDLQKEFDKILNSVTVILDKDHENGQKTTQTLLINKDFAKNSIQPTLVYGNYSDTTDWLKYKQRSIWQFRGGASYESDWKMQDAAMINLYTPFRRRSIRLDGDMQALRQQGIRAVSVQISYPFFNQPKQERITVGIGESLNDKGFEITQPNDQEEVDYDITWIKTNGTSIQTKGKDKTGIIFIDELPANP